MDAEFLVFGSPVVGEEEIAEVEETIRSGWMGTGPRVARFESEFAAYTGAPHALALNSCTAALHVALVAAGIAPGDEVITTPLTFAATANSIVHAGAVPVFADVDRRTMNIDPERVAEAITPRTRAIVPVHFAGRPADMDALMDVARRHDLVVIEDCAHAVETLHRGRHAGTMGDVGCFSFYVTKNMITVEGGMLITPSSQLADTAKVLSLHGMSRDAWKRFSDEGYRHYQVVAPGFKYNMTDLQAAFGIHQLARVESLLPRREEIWTAYDDAFADLPCETPAEPDADTRHARHLYTLLIDPDETGITRDEFLDHMTAAKIGVGVHYVPVHTHPYYAERFGHQPADFPHAAAIGERTVSIPLSGKLTDADVERVIATVRDVVLSGATAASR